VGTWTRENPTKIIPATTLFEEKPGKSEPGRSSAAQKNQAMVQATSHRMERLKPTSRLDGVLITRTELPKTSRNVLSGSDTVRLNRLRFPPLCPQCQLSARRRLELEGSIAETRLGRLSNRKSIMLSSDSLAALRESIFGRKSWSWCQVVVANSFPLAIGGPGRQE